MFHTNCDCCPHEWEPGYDEWLARMDARREEELNRVWPLRKAFEYAREYGGEDFANALGNLGASLAVFQ
jgi:hypothetical protein